MVPFSEKILELWYLIELRLLIKLPSFENFNLKHKIGYIYFFRTKNIYSKAEYEMLISLFQLEMNGFASLMLCIKIS